MDPSISIFNDRFGYLSVSLHKYNQRIVSHFKSQMDAIEANYKHNNLKNHIPEFSVLLDSRDTQSDIVAMKVPKSMELFHLFLIKIYQMSHADTKVYCGFMTKHFTKQMLEIAALYFGTVEQSLAWKKSRVLILSKPKNNIKEVSPINKISFTNENGEQILFRQYFGVFSSKHIDFATQFLLANLSIEKSVSTALDLACGNGVIAHHIRQQSETTKIHLLDDSYLAMESAKLNIKNGSNFFHYNYHLDDFENDYFDLIVCNPPFHFEHENTIDIALQLFRGVSRVLKKGGEFILVSNLHLNYKTHLSKIFNRVEVINMNKKYELIGCSQ